MPQMAPINWLFMLIYTVMLMFMMSTMMYFIFPYKPLKKVLKKSKKINWKW